MEKNADLGPEMAEGEGRKEKPPAEIAYELGYEYEGKYGACSQCTILAVMDARGTQDPSAFKAAFGFAGGIGSYSETCGALMAGVMAISLEHGRALENLTTITEETRRGCMKMVRALYARYIEEYGTIRCADVHQQIFGRTFNQWDDDDFQEFLRLGGHVDKCTDVVGKVARWTVEILQGAEEEV